MWFKNDRFSFSLTGAIESLIDVLMNLLKTLDRVGASVVCPNKDKNTAFRVTSGPGREKYCANTRTNWNSWNTLSPRMVGFFVSIFFSKNIQSAISSKHRSWFFLLVHKLSGIIQSKHYFDGIFAVVINERIIIDSSNLPIRVNASFAHCGKSVFLGFL